ncbi:HU family DNA-binding protein [Candidatus Phytoplasma fraxini]|uniref:DNA-binding protein HU n=1 Tax=Ash yellows phytoplasma TaxID=35780 RepID=A0ABZ2UD77_ASHYP
MKKINEKINKKELIKQISEAEDVTVKETESFYNLFEEILFDTIINYKEVILGTSLGKFVVQDIPPKTRPKMKAIKLKNDQMTFKSTGKMITYPASKKVNFKFSNTLKQAIKK